MLQITHDIDAGCEAAGQHVPKRQKITTMYVSVKIHNYTIGPPIIIGQPFGWVGEERERRKPHCELCIRVAWFLRKQKT